MAAITSITKVGSSAKIEYDDGSILYSWPKGRYYINIDGDTVEAINYELSPDDNYNQTIFKYSNLTQVYGTSTVEEYVEYLIQNEIFFSPDGRTETRSIPEAIKITESGKLTYFAWAAPGSAEADAVWKAMRIDDSVTNESRIMWADNGNYSQVATDLTALTYS